MKEKKAKMEGRKRKNAHMKDFNIKILHIYPL